MRRRPPLIFFRRSAVMRLVPTYFPTVVALCIFVGIVTVCFLDLYDEDILRAKQLIPWPMLSGYGLNESKPGTAFHLSAYNSL